MSDPRRTIPSVDRLLGSDSFAPLLRTRSRARVTAAIQAVQEQVRAALAGGAAQEEHGDVWWAAAVAASLEERERPSLRPVINATGVVLHTNLGRAPLAAEALAAVQQVAGDYANLEYDTREGRRGSRYTHCASLLRELTGAEDALVVNNNAAALLLALDTLAAGRTVLVSRGELVEIGDGFRVPEIVTRSGARLREVGATNRTHAADYERALDADVAALLKVHRSNFRMTGFVADVPLESLLALARRAGVPLVHDLGSGLLLDAAALGLPPERTAFDSLAAGADVVAISGDKLLGGPQAGILLGRSALLARMRRNPLCRALRVDKLTLAALEATLALYREPAIALERIPILRMITLAAPVLRTRAEAVAGALRDAGVHADVIPADGAVGGGAMPDARLAGFAVAIDVPAGAAALDVLLRAREPAVVGRIDDDRLLLDVRTVPPELDGALVDAVRAVVP